MFLNKSARYASNFVFYIFFRRYRTAVRQRATDFNLESNSVWFNSSTHLLMVLLVERENVGFSISSSPRCTEMLSSSCNAAFRASIAAKYSEVCNDPLVGFRYLKRYNGSCIKNTTYQCKNVSVYCTPTRKRFSDASLVLSIPTGKCVGLRPPNFNFGRLQYLLNETNSIKQSVSWKF